MIRLTSIISLCLMMLFTIVLADKKTPNIDKEAKEKGLEASRKAKR